jgi:DNA-binding transcriptional MerR regulator
MFKDDDFDSLNMIECLKKSGMSIKDIKTFMDWCMQGSVFLFLMGSNAGRACSFAHSARYVVPFPLATKAAKNGQ